MLCYVYLKVCTIVASTGILLLYSSLGLAPNMYVQTIRSHTTGRQDI